MPMVDVLAGPGSRKVEAILTDTWGNLAPERRRYYRGTIILAYGHHAGLTMLDYDFADLDGNPWTHEHVGTWFRQQAVLERYFARPYDVRLWRWEGLYMVAKNGNPKFSGKIRPLRLVDRFPGKKKAKTAPRATNH